VTWKCRDLCWCKMYESGCPGMVVAISVDGKVTDGEGRERGLKCSVQRKLRWVENGVNRSVGASDCGAGYYFEYLIHQRLVLNTVCFLFRSVQQSY
jgi:hypothetical protein